jgi:hypothetical protein
VHHLALALEMIRREVRVVPAMDKTFDHLVEDERAMTLVQHSSKVQDARRCKSRQHHGNHVI